MHNFSSSTSLNGSETSKRRSANSATKRSTKPSKNLKRLSSTCNVPLTFESVISSSLMSNSRASRTISVPGSKEEVLACDSCKGIFSNKSGFQRHNCRKHMTQKEKLMTSSVQERGPVLNCEQCGKVVPTAIGLKRHITAVHKSQAASDTSGSLSTQVSKPLTRSQKKK